MKSNKKSKYKKYRNRYGFWYVKKSRDKKYKYALINNRLYKKENIYIKKDKKFWQDSGFEYMRKTIQVYNLKYKKVYENTHLYRRRKGTKRYIELDETRKYINHKKIDIKEVKPGQRVRLMWRIRGLYIWDEYVKVDNPKFLKYIIDEKTEYLLTKYEIDEIEFIGIFEIPISRLKKKIKNRPKARIKDRTKTRIKNRTKTRVKDKSKIKIFKKLY